jgi:hypothetical protein
MASVPSVSTQIPLSSEENPRTTIEAFGIKLDIPLPKWAIAWLAVLSLALVVSAAVYWSVTKIGKTVLVPASQMEVYEESSFHSAEPPEFKMSKEEKFDLTTVTINYFKTDGCVQIVRWDAARNQGDGLWIFGAHPHASGHNHALNSSFQRPEMQSSSPASGALKLASYEPRLDSDEDQTPRAHLRRVQGGSCMNPHPGSFSVRNQQISQCSIQVWRMFSDGCVHYQYFNPCAGTWDVNPNGSPRVVWTRCIH